ncbi:gamma-interferon-inducible lysosomal thiol reductase [Rhineura floridana]|uniref:gamma-interferon-inducible lysosomal thiol reductase n=1 Tax=Rhineura floridana TaxID=261503 RepID=UPI002AC7FEC7|nr:gamma-interferon-inducible lysosomal thiol reductase [Rhineura floridana]
MGLWFLTVACSSLWVGLGLGGAPCKYPPHLWCSSREIAQACKAEKQCAKVTSAPQKADPVSISLYYESLCPACRSFLVLQLFPTWLMLGDIMDITLVPYGNAKERKGATKWEFECQHGPDECLGNVMEACLIHLFEDMYFPLIFCMESSANVTQNLPTCMKLYRPDISLANLTACVNGDLGNKLMHANAERTRALNPPHKYVPWIVINGSHTEALQSRSQAALFKMVCDLYKGEPPVACLDKKSPFPHSQQYSCLNA